jgi:EpsI family protein
VLATPDANYVGLTAVNDHEPQGNTAITPVVAPQSQRGLHVALVVAAMVLCSLLAWWLQPSAASRQAPAFELEALFTAQLPGWRLEPAAGGLIVNPQLQASVEKLYSQVLTRTYVNTQGYRIMLSVAYGNDQRGALQAHYPDLCYPAQGFKVLASQRGDVPLSGGTLPIRRLETELGARKEPLSYWFVYGQRLLATDTMLQKRLIDIRLGLQGRIADGLLVRVSSIDGNTASAYAQQDAFVRVLVDAVDSASRHRVIGLPKS